MRTVNALIIASLLAASAVGCGREAIVSSDLPVRRVVIYRNGVAYFERAGHVEDAQVKFKMKESEIGDFLATLAVMETGGSSVRSAAFPLKIDDENKGAKPKKPQTEDERRGIRSVVLSLDGRSHDLQVGYIAEAPVWRPSYRLVVQAKGQAELQAWGIVQNLSGEDWRNVQLSLVAGAPLAFEAQLGRPIIPPRPIVTDMGEVIAAVPRSETSLQQEKQDNSPDKAGRARREEDDGEDGVPATEASKPKGAPAATAAAPAPPPPPMQPGAAGGSRYYRDAPGDPMGGEGRVMPSGPRNLRSLAAIAVEGGSTRFDLPQRVDVPDKSATMVLLLARQVPGEAIFLFSPDGGVPDSTTHPFRVARFVNKTAGVLERGPIAVFEAGSFLGQGMVDPLPAGATATVPFALERAIAVDTERKHDELGERVARIENGNLMIERDAVTKTKYKVRNGGRDPAKVLVKHARVPASRLVTPPKDTEDNVGTGTALVPVVIAGSTTGELVVDERQTTQRWESWFSPLADAAVKGYLADPRADKGVVQKLTAAWALRKEIVDRYVQRDKFDREKHELGQASEDTRRNLKAIEKNKDKEAEQLRGRLTKRLTDLVSRLDELTRQSVENSLKLSELEVRFKEAIREIKVTDPLPPLDGASRIP